MTLRFHNALTGRVEEFRPASPPRINLRCALAPEGRSEALGAFRYNALVSCAREALAYLGYAVADADGPAGGPAELYLGPEPPPPRVRCWLKVEAHQAGGSEVTLEEVEARGFDSLDLRLLCLKTHYRRPLEVTWARLAEARGEKIFLRESGRRLSAAHGSSAPNSRGLAGYKKRFRDALSCDLDIPEALGSVWDALRPGALSPGSQLAALREAGSVLGLAVFDDGREKPRSLERP